MIIEEYSRKIQQILQLITEEEEGRISVAIQIIGDAIIEKDIFHVIGTGAHGSIVAEELLWRVGGLAAVNSILDPSVNLIHGAARSGIMDQTGCNSKAILDSYGVKKGDTLIIVNSSGINAFSIEMANTCKANGIKTIAITSKFGLLLAEPSQYNLFQLADHYIDNHMPYGDAVLDIENYNQKVGPVSTICNVFIANLLVSGTIRYLLEKGVEPPVWKYDACPGGEEFNKGLFEKYRWRVRHLV